MSGHHTEVSKFLSYVLRHAPETIGLTLDGAGWAPVEELIRCAAEHGRDFSVDLIREVVETSDKQRFALSSDGLKIRANQGHSIQVDLGLEPTAPPDLLYHGTATRFLDSILQSGLHPQSRQHVHLSPDPQTATRVGQRHGKPAVLVIDAKSMSAVGAQFFLSKNGVWLTDNVPPEFISLWEI